jgi:hypothetical protein
MMWAILRANACENATIAARHPSHAATHCSWFMESPSEKVLLAIHRIFLRPETAVTQSGAVHPGAHEATRASPHK